MSTSNEPTNLNAFAFYCDSILYSVDVNAATAQIKHIVASGKLMLEQLRQSAHSMGSDEQEDLFVNLSGITDEVIAFIA